MKPWWLASALLLANVSAAQGPKALREEFRNPSLRYRMNVNRHSMPREERAQDSMIRWILDNGYRGMATNVNPDDYLRSDDRAGRFQPLRACRQEARARSVALRRAFLSVGHGPYLCARRTSRVGSRGPAVPRYDRSGRNDARPRGLAGRESARTGVACDRVRSRLRPLARSVCFCPRRPRAGLRRGPLDGGRDQPLGAVRGLSGRGPTGAEDTPALSESACSRT